MTTRAAEVAVQFGADDGLTGIVTTPPGDRGAVAFILITAGLIPKYGPYRFYVRLARHLADAGVLTLRFDLGGIGDSAKTTGAMSLIERTEIEIRAAVDFVCAQYGLSRVALGGLCSGGEDAFRYAERDARVTGVMMIDPFVYRTSGWAWRHWLYRLARRSLRAAGLYKPVAQRKAATLPGGGTLIEYKYMEPAESTRILGALISRKVRTHFVYTGGVIEEFNHPGQVQKMFPTLNFAGCVTVDHLSTMGHTQILEEDRETLVTRIAQWFSAFRDRN